jgi:DNA-binding response OmpR family regulator
VPPLSTRTALVVDDEVVIRRLVRTVLEADDFAVMEAADGFEALNLAEAASPSVVILDVMMPQLDGVEVCRRLDHDALKVVMLTARDDPELEKRCRDAGADAFLTKPFSSLELLDLLEALTS